MKDYRRYELHDFLNDDSFREWSRDPDGCQAEFWKQWLTDNPDRLDTVLQAMNFLLVMHNKFTATISAEEVSEMVDRLLVAAHEQTERETNIHRLDAQSMPYRIWLVAASICLVIGISWWFTSFHHQTATDMLGHFQRWERKANETDHPVTFRLSDGSQVTLESNSRLWYPRDFRQPKREVYLKGKAFFDVAKNQRQPFVVYTTEFITQVAGTRFLIHSYAQEGTATVTVKSGRVTVQPRHQEVSPVKTQLVLVDNQQAVYFREEARIEKVMVHSLCRTSIHCL